MAGRLYVYPYLLVAHNGMKLLEMWLATVPRWRGIKGVDWQKHEFW
ncbi:MAG: hypothetical protein HKUEN01_00700 [Candidatus Kuenenia stuttgartiensis]|nr:MAG: hypothetical protein HKUEN01_00700 [Candidatus Kuenenia stuttgartiensis]